jgi:hypothetical protein
VNVALGWTSVRGLTSSSVPAPSVATVKPPLVQLCRACVSVASVPATVVNWAGDDTVSDRQMGEYVAELTGITPNFIESPISFDSFAADNSRRELLIGKCSMHWKDGVRDTFERLGIIGA